MMILDRSRAIAKGLRRTLKLSPMHNVLRYSKRQGFNLKTMNALELFGSDGQNHTKDIVSSVANVEIWEIRPECEAILKQSFPNSEIKIADSYAEIARTPKKFDLIVVDNPGHVGDYIEHFALFPNIFRVLNNPALIILNVVPIVYSAKDTERLNARQKFYNATDPTNITFDEMETAYRALVAENGWVVDWIFFERRWTFYLKRAPLYYAALKLRRSPGDYH